MEDLSKMSKEDYQDWTEFRSNTSNQLRKGEFELVCQLHAKYYKHPFYKPCTCSPRTINKWIAMLNDVYAEGV
jgi:hypothetical protein